MASDDFGSKEQEIIVRRLNALSLLRPLLVGAALLALPIGIAGIVSALFGGVIVNGEAVSGLPAVLWVLALAPCFALVTGITLWLYVSACLWAYSRWSELRLRFVPR